MTSYTVRRATLADIDVLVEHRALMYEDMGLIGRSGPDRDRLTRHFRSWLAGTMKDDTYVAWLVDSTRSPAEPTVAAGAGAMIIPWPPGPFYSTGRLAFVYNVYTHPDHRRRGLGRLLMDTIHTYCRSEGVGSVALNASVFGRPLYEAMGYRVATSPMMFLSLE